MPRRSSFRALQWLFPIAATLHNIEEGIWLPGFAAAHAAEIPWHVDSGNFRFALIVLTAAAWVVTYLSWRQGPQSVCAYLVFGSMVAMFVNVFVPHIPAALRFGGYAPGLVTAVILNAPVMSVVVIRAVQERYVSGRKALAFGVGVPVGLALAILLFFAIGTGKR